MSFNLTDDNRCAANDTLCIVAQYQQAVIIVPTLLLLSTFVTLVALFLTKYCPERKQARTAPQPRYQGSQHRRTHRQSRRDHLQGIDAPPGINPLEHEELPMSVQQVHQNVKPTLAAVPAVATQGPHGAFSHVTALPMSFSVDPDEKVNICRARMDNRDVVLRRLKETANISEKQQFLGLASFVSGLGTHPFLPALLGVVSVQTPLVMVMEEMQHRDLLSFLWRCRQVNTGSAEQCEITEKRIFNMAGNVASALDYLHIQRCVHGNVAARSVLIGGDMTAKLWGLSSAYHRRAQIGSQGDGENVEMKKWKAPEVLSRRGDNESSDVWSFGILLYEMATLGDPPFAELLSTELLQHLQRGKHLKKPATCSNSLYSIIRSCCQWNPQHRLSMNELIRKLQAGEDSANGRTVLRVPEPINIERYLREAGYGETLNYAIL